MRANNQSGITLIEMLLALAVIAVLLMAALGRFGIKKNYYQWTKNVAQVQSSVAQLLQAGNVYFYTTCSDGVEAKVLTQQDLIAKGNLSNSSDAFNNPWGAAYTVNIVSANKASGAPYAIQVSGNFSGISKTLAGQLAQLLNANPWTGGTTLTWTQLPSMGTADLGVWYGKPANIVAVNNTGSLGGVQMNSNFWVMKASMDYYSKITPPVDPKQKLNECLNLSS